MKKYIIKFSASSLFAMILVLSILFFENTIKAQNLPAPTNTSASPSTISCSSSSTLNATSQYTITWFTVATGGTPIGTANGTSGFTVSPVVTTTYYAEADQYASGSITLSYTGAVQSWTVPAGVSAISVDVQGAQGGTSSGGNGGLGGRIQGNISVSTGSVLYFYVGGQGDAITSSGGWNGGGNGYGSSTHGGGGGGASDIRIGGITYTNRVIVAGGGGGASGNGGGVGHGGYGGGLSGGYGLTNTNSTVGIYSASECGGGGTQTAGGAAATYVAGTSATAGGIGIGGNAANNIAPGGGGGGYRGGGGGGWAGGGGGGSSWYSASCSGVVMTSGYKSGNGQISFSWSPITNYSSTRTPVTVTVLGLSPATSVTATPSSVACGSSTNLSAISSGNIISWFTSSTGGSSIGSSASGVSFMVYPQTSATYYAEAYNNNPCLSTSRVPVSVTVVPILPPSTATASPSSICAGGQSQLTATSTGNLIKWWSASTGGTLLGSSYSGTNYTVLPTVTTTYYAEAYMAGSGSQTFSYTGAIVTWSVPGGINSIIIDAKGASGGYSSSATAGKGARMQGEFSVSPGNVLSILVGQSPGLSTAYPAGGGGTFVALGSSYTTATQMIAAGGGGGAYSTSTGVNAPTTTSGTGTSPGTNGNGAPSSSCAGGGGGFYSSGGNDLIYSFIGGKGFRQGGAGGTASSSYITSYQTGGFGGGASANYVGSCNTRAGSGGGYSGGSANSTGLIDIGQAGGSFNGGTNQTNTAGYQNGNGQVIISWTSSSCTSALRTSVTVNISAVTNPTSVSATPNNLSCGTNVNLTATSGFTVSWWDASTGGNMLGTSSTGVNLTVLPTTTTTFYAEANSFIPVSKTFSYTGAVQSWTIPTGVGSVTVDASGAQGGQYSSYGTGGLGGRVQTSLSVNFGQNLLIYVGGKPTSNLAGWNGGGSTGTSSGGGGGATDIRINGNSLTDRVVVAGGGGGGGYYYATSYGGAGGGTTTAGNGLYNNNFNVSYSGSGGSQTAGGVAATYSSYPAQPGTFGIGGNQTSNYGGAGGGGYYGGGAGSYYGGGGGGSSWASTTLTSNTIHSQGYQTGNGQLTLSWNEIACSSPGRVSITVIVTQLPNAANVTATPQTVACASTSILSATSSTGIIRWWDASTGGNLLSTTISGGSFSVSPISNTVYYVEAFNNPCLSTSRVSITITVSQLPNPTNITASSQNVSCASSTNLSAIVSSGAITWWDSATGGNLLGTTISAGIITVVPTTNTTYYAENNTFVSGSLTFNYTGTVQSWIVPTGVLSIIVDAKGAQGGQYSSYGSGGLGGRVQTNISVSSGQNLQIYVGGKPTSNGAGWNGGGSNGLYSGGGGGATDIRINGNALANRVIVAGGGGGGGYNYSTSYGGAGGGTTAASGLYNNTYSATYCGGGGSQTAGGSQATYSSYVAQAGTLGIGGNQTSNYGGAGGGGYYGGGAGSYYGGGGGGSSWTSSTLTSNTTHTQGFQTGNGQLSITWNSITCSSSSRTSITISISQLGNASNVIATPQTVVCGSSSYLSATSSGSIVSWWDSSVGGTIIGTSLSGNSFVVIPSTTTTYYAESNAIAPASLTFSYTGLVQNWVVPTGVVSVSVDASGAQGGSINGVGGLGGRVRTNLSVSSGQLLFLYVGGHPTSNTGGWNGGGNSVTGGAGGGATEIRLDSNLFSHRVIVAGGGGGSGDTSISNGGAGGGTVAGNGLFNGIYNATDCGEGGSQTIGGSPATSGGIAGTTGSGGAGVLSGGGGGGGYFGGGGGYLGGGGGGSSWTSNNVTSNTTYIQGYQSGNGQVILSWNVMSCSSIGRISVTISVSQLPNPTNVLATPQNVTCGMSSNLSATSSAGIIRWWDAPTGGSIIGTSDIGAYFAVFPSINTVYYAEAINSICTSSNRIPDSVIVSNINPPTLAASVLDTVYCGGYTNISAISAGNTIKWWDAPTGGNMLGSSPSGVGYIVFPSTTTTYYAEAYNICTSNLRDSVTVNLMPIPPPTISNSNISICTGGSVGLSALSSGNIINWWSASTGGTLLATVNSGNNYIVSPTSTTTYYAEAYSAGSGSQVFTYSGNTIQNWSVPGGVTSITIDARGAEGGNQSDGGIGSFGTGATQYAGLGARMVGTFSVASGQQLKILVGGQASNATTDEGAGGGGGSFVTTSLNIPLIVAGGGGGEGADANGVNASITTSGTAANTGGAGGTGGSGGSVYGLSTSNGSAGGGLLTDGGDACSGGKGVAFVNGGNGGISCGGGGSAGGFGGGGGGSAEGGGGGGGYSGGGGAGSGIDGGGGGGSFNAGTNQTNTAAYNTGNGRIIISWTSITCTSLLRTSINVNISTPSNSTNVSATPSNVACGNGAALNANFSGFTTSWWDSPTGGNVLGTSSVDSLFVFPTTTTVYYAEEGSYSRSSQNYTYSTSVVQTWTVPNGVYSIYVDAKGASGYNSSFAAGGLGGRVQTNLSVTPGQILNIFLGQMGLSNTFSSGGWNGGGNGGLSGPGGGGGGATDIRIGGTLLTDRVIVAGGGGGCGTNATYPNSTGGDGGNSNALNGTYNSNYSAIYCGSGATLSSGGVAATTIPPAGTGAQPGLFGVGGASSLNGNGGGGGGGYYGGGGGAIYGGGGGGSSWVTPNGSSNTVYTQGFQLGKGRILITWFGVFCSSGSRVSVTVTVGLPDAPTLIAYPPTVCTGTSTSLNATSAIGVIYWWDSPTGGNLLGSSISGTDFSVTLNNTRTFYAETNSICGISTRSSIRIIVTNPADPTNVIASQTSLSCGGSTNLSAVFNGGFIRWWTAPSGGIMVGTTASGSDLTVYPYSNTTYYAESYSTCASTSRVSISISVTTIPLPTSVFASLDTIYCGGNTDLLATSLGNTIRWWDSPTGGTMIGSIYSGGLVTVYPASTTTYYVESYQSPCASATRISLTIIVNPLDAPSLVLATPPSYCINGSSNLNASSFGNAINWWDSSTGGVFLGTTQSGTSFIVSPTATTTYYAESYSGSSGSLIFNYTGTEQIWNVPIGVTSVTIDAKGAQGGSYSTYGAGGLGGRLQTNLNVAYGQTLKIYVGGKPASNTAGWNGGGSNGLYSGGGGGATDIRIGGSSLSYRVLVAGGGGGGGYSYATSYGGAGGGTTGATGMYNNAYNATYCGTGGSQSAGGIQATYASYPAQPGVLGVGGNQTSNYGGAGGGGYYGGGAGSYYGGGGGGSSWTSPVLTSNTSHTQGSQTGNGQLTITWSGTSCSSIRVPVTVSVSTTNSVEADSVNLSPLIICANDSAFLSTAGGTLSTGSNWYWYTGSCGGTLVGTNSSISLIPVSGDYYVRAEGGCNTTTCVKTTVTLSVSSVSANSISATQNLICLGFQTTINLTGGSLGTNSDWYWYAGSCGGTLLGSGISLTDSPTNITTYYVRAEGSCNTTTCVSTTVIVNSNSIDPTSATGSSLTLCSGLPTTLSTTGGSLGLGATWVWYSNSCGGTYVKSITSPTLYPTTTTTYYVRAENLCNSTSCVSVTIDVIQLPSIPSVINGTNVPINGNTEIYSITNVPGVTYTWTAPSGWVGTSTTNSITYTVGVTDGIVSVIPNNTCGNGIGRSIIVGTGYQINGTFTYNNNASTILDSLWVNLMYHGSKVDSIQADINGNYQFNNIPNGDYNVTATSQKPWSGVNITDVVLTKRHFAGSLLLTSSLKIHSADVNLSNLINITDAIRIARRYAGADTSFTRGDWGFEKPFGGDTINVSTYLNDSVIVNGGNISQDFKGICIGDVNGSYQPQQGAKESPKVAINHNNVIKLNNNEYFEMPLKVNGNINVGAISLILNYPKELVSISNVLLATNKGYEDVYYHVKGNELRIGWFETDGGIDMNENESYIIIKLKTTSKFKQGDVINFEVANNYLCEFADFYGIPYNNVTLNTYSIENINTMNIESISNINNEMYIYPNPANDNVNINYTIAKDGVVIISLYNVLGEKVSEIVNNSLIKGTHKSYININSLQTGVYIVRMTVDNKSTIVKRLVISR